MALKCLICFSRNGKTIWQKSKWMSHMDECMCIIHSKKKKEKKTICFIAKMIQKINALTQKVSLFYTSCVLHLDVQNNL